MKGGIYAISMIGRSDRYYIGSAVNFRKRWAVHRHHLREGTHHCTPLQNAWRKYGPKAFEFAMLEMVSDKQSLLSREQVWLDSFHPYYNVAPVAGSSLGRKHSIESRARISASKRGTKYSQLARSNMAKARIGNKNTLGHKLTSEHRAKISKALSGKGYWKRAQDAAAAARRARTHCKRGHELSGQNLYLHANGSRECKECKKIHKRNYRARVDRIAAQAGIYIPMDLAA